MRGTNSGSISLDDIDGAIREASILMMTEVASELHSLKRSFERTLSETTNWYLDRDSVVAGLAEEHGSLWLQNLAFSLSSCSAAAWGAVIYEKQFPSLVLKVGEFLAKLISSEEGVLAKWNGGMGIIDPNPVKGLAAFLGRFRSSVFLSATINPSAVFLRSLGVSDLQPEVYLSETVSFVSVRTIIDTGVTTKFKSRSPQMYSKIAAKVAAVVKATDGGVGVFAPSYSVLGPIAEMVAKRVNGRSILSESRGMSSDAAAGIIDSMTSVKGSLLFAVQGGRFSEGEDFRGDLMDAVAVVGLSLPPPSPMLYAEYACLKSAGEPDSYLMLSRLPALRKAFQAAGRHIREPGKRGLVLLLDHRFDAPATRELMPSWLSEDTMSGDFEPHEIESIVSDFWMRRLPA
jgi:DNA excision repair protein ERCC-2